MNRKNLPLFLMLVAGAITAIMTFALGYSLKSKLLALLVVLIIFYLLGSLIKWLLDLFEKQHEEKKQEEGEVIEKEESELKPEEQGEEGHG